MHPFIFSKQRAKELINAFDSNGDVVAPYDGWTQDELLRLAGAAYLMAFFHGLGTKSYEEYKRLPLEHREATVETHREEILAVIKSCGALTVMVRDNEYDQDFEPVVEVEVRRDSEGEIDIQFIKGKKT